MRARPPPQRWRGPAEAPNVSGRMLTVLEILLGVALTAVALTLATGVYSLLRGGQFGRTWSNRLMRLRVALQFTAICLLAAVWWLGQHVHKG